MKKEMSRGNFLNTVSSMILYIVIFGAATGSMAGDADLAHQSVAETDLARTRFEGTVAIFYEASKQVITREWDNIEQFNGPYHPLLGYYNYATKDTLTQHLRWIRRAGVDVIVYDVFALDKWRITDIEEDRVLRWLLEALENQQDEERKLKLVIYLEGYLTLPTLDEYRFGLKYIREHMAEKPYYFRFHGRPLALLYHCTDEMLHKVQLENEYFAVRRIQPFRKKSWSYIQHWPQKLNREWMPVSPGIDSFMEDCYLKQTKRKKKLDLSEISEMRKNIRADEREDGAYFRKQFLRAREVNPEIIFISGWNDWQFGSQIEPAKEYKFKYVDLAAQMLGRWDETASYRDDP